jgi:quinohemoprotein ethanol dehydrogenase
MTAPASHRLIAGIEGEDQLKLKKLIIAAILCGGLPVLLPASLMAADGQTRAAAVDATRMSKAEAEPANWMNVGGTYKEWHYSPLDQINLSTIGRLKLAWYADLDTYRGQEATPLVIDGVLYTSTAWSKVYAFDAATGKELWRYDPGVPGKTAVNACCDVVNRGVAAWNGKIFVGALDGRLIALNAHTGKPVWSVQTTDPSRPYTITGAPRVVKGKVLIGNGGGEFGVRGYVTAYDAETGKQAWRFYTTPNPRNEPDGAASDKALMEIAYKTWGNGAWKETGGGGTAWDAIVYDEEFDQILIGTGNGSPWNHRVRSGPDGGDDLFLSSIVAVDPETGAYRWHHQETPGEEWDFTATQPIMLADLEIDGKRRKVLMHAPKNGFFYVIDRSNGKLISAKNFTPVNWTTGIDMNTGRPVEYHETRYSRNGGDILLMPAAFGSHNWHPMAYSPKTNLVYLPTQEIPFGYADDKGFKYTPGLGRWNLGDASSQNAGPQSEAHRKALKAMTRGQLIAWDPVQQREVWRVQHSSVGAGGVLATAGNLVFQGMPDGRLIAYRADTGEKVWSFDGFNGVIAGAMSYRVGSDQYIAVLAGFGGSNGLQVPYIDNVSIGENGRVLVFKLDATATLPNNRRPVLPVNVPSEQWPDEIVKKGAELYGNCVFCHGSSTYSNGVIPDLRRSANLSDKETWQSIVIDGVLQDNGMVSFVNRLSPEDAEAIRAYIADRARQLARDEATEKADVVHTAD